MGSIEFEKYKEIQVIGRTSENEKYIYGQIVRGEKDMLFFCPGADTAFTAEQLKEILRRMKEANDKNAL